MSEQYQKFLGKLNGSRHGQAQYFDPDHPPTFDNGTVTFYLKHGTPPSVAPHLAGRLAPKVAEAIRAAWGEDAPGHFDFETKRDIAPLVQAAAQADDFGEDDDDYQGVYHNPENAIIKPGKTEWSATQYYRQNWRPLLGPTSSELVRELRQRCHFKTRRNKFETTYKSLAAALGVSERTIKRVLKRDKAGRFTNKYLHYFIADIQTIRETNGEGKIRTKGTRFLIYLDDTITPDDRAKLPKGQNGT